MSDYDVIVVGADAAGLSAALARHAAGTMRGELTTDRLCATLDNTNRHATYSILFRTDCVVGRSRLHPHRARRASHWSSCTDWLVGWG